jgi:hypothetical protein
VVKQGRFCIFCGDPPDEKTKEHVLPQWLIELTGHPKRVVNFGFDLPSGKQPRFDWSSFVFPACKVCNGRHSNLEGKMKHIIGHLLTGTPVTGHDYIDLLDWLDKVRIGLWLGYFYLHGNPAGISPNFYINARIGQKDRMVAIYTIEADKNGLNAYGAETLCFQIVPCCFSLNIKNLHILNVSWDYMCSARSGFPFPRRMFINFDNDRLLECSDVVAAHKVKHPLLRTPIIKPAVQIFQPILQAPPITNSESPDTWVKSMLLPGSEQQGLLIRQYDTHTEVIKDLVSLIEYNEVAGHHCRPLKDIIAQTYELQGKIFQGVEYHSSDPAEMAKIKEMKKAVIRITGMYKNAFRNIQKPNP